MISDNIENIEQYISSFSTRICEINNVNSLMNVIEQVERHFEKQPIIKNHKYGVMPGRAWVLIGKKNKADKKYVVLQVAQSLDILKEIKIVIFAMYNKELIGKMLEEKFLKINLDIIESPKTAFINSTNNSYEFQEGRQKIKHQYLYRFLKKNYVNLQIFEVDIDKYLKTDENIIDKDYGYFLSKDYIAESKLAIETEALYWNYFNSGVGKRAYDYFNDIKNNL